MKTRAERSLAIGCWTWGILTALAFGFPFFIALFLGPDGSTFLASMLLGVITCGLGWVGGLIVGGCYYWLSGRRDEGRPQPPSSNHD